MSNLKRLKMILHMIISEDTNYDMRNLWIYQALGLAAEMDYPCGMETEGEENRYLVVKIALPTGIIKFMKWGEHFATSSGITNERIRKFISS